MRVFFFIRILLFFTTLLMYYSSLAQLRVSNNGNVGIKTIDPFSDLHVVGMSLFTSTSSYPSSSAFIRGNNNFSGPTNPDYTWFNNDQVGIFHPSLNVIGFSTYGTERMRITGNGQVAIGGNPYSTYKFTIYGDAYAYGGTWVPSDLNYKKNIKGIEGALVKVLGIDGKSFEYKTNEFVKEGFKEGRMLGFIAQELKEVLPEAVRRDSSGFYSVNYDEVIPVLVEAIKEMRVIVNTNEETISKLEQRVTELEEYITSMESLKSARSKDKTNDTMQSPLLLQNNPNPFTSQTIIRFQLPLEFSNACIVIYNMEGIQLEKRPLNKGDSQIIIKGKDFKPGMYLYVLFVDNKEIDTKKMILTDS